MLGWYDTVDDEGQRDLGRSRLMDPWTISALYEIRRAEDQERVARIGRDGWKQSARPSRRPRERAAAALLGLAVRLAPSIEEVPAESRPVASVPQL
jgi:hypothetical protein